MANIETARLHRFGQCRSRLLIDMRTQFAFHHRIQERENFALFTADLEFDPAIGQISGPADYVEALGDLPNRPTKADALDIALVKNLK